MTFLDSCDSYYSQNENAGVVRLMDAEGARFEKLPYSKKAVDNRKRVESKQALR